MIIHKINTISKDDFMSSRGKIFQCLLKCRGSFFKACTRIVMQLSISIVAIASCCLLMYSSLIYNNVLWVVTFIHICCTNKFIIWDQREEIENYWGSSQTNFFVWYLKIPVQWLWWFKSILFTSRLRQTTGIVHRKNIARIFFVKFASSKKASIICTYLFQLLLFSLKILYPIEFLRIWFLGINSTGKKVLNDFVLNLHTSIRTMIFFIQFMCILPGT
jgi:hypothetical protein